MVCAPLAPGWLQEPEQRVLPDAVTRVESSLGSGAAFLKEQGRCMQPDGARALTHRVRVGGVVGVQRQALQPRYQPAQCVRARSGCGIGEA